MLSYAEEERITKKAAEMGIALTFTAGGIFAKSPRGATTSTLPPTLLWKMRYNIYGPMITADIPSADQAKEEKHVRKGQRSAGHECP